MDRREEAPTITEGRKEIVKKDLCPDQRYAYRNGAAKLSGAILKELARKPDVFRNLENFQPKGGLQQRQIVCSPTGITVEFSSPLQGTSTPAYIQTHKRPDLISDKILSSAEDEDFEPSSSSKSTVIAVDCKWKNGVKLQNAINPSRSHHINPTLKTVDFDFESKTKFTKAIDQICDEYFPLDNVLILEGNYSHGSSLRYSSPNGGSNSESEVIPEIPFNPNLPHYQQDKLRPGTNVVDPCSTESIEYNDRKEHKILLVPSYTKSGFETETSERYRFPYKANFLIGTKRYEKSFELLIPFAEAPQHFGLIFTFPEKKTSKSSKSNPNPQTNVIIKTMISVYSVYPHTPRHGSLTFYEFPDMLPSKASSSGKKNSKVQPTAARLIAQEYVANMNEQLVEEKLVPRGWKQESFEIRHELKGRHLVKEQFQNGKPHNRWNPDLRAELDNRRKSKRQVEAGIRRLEG